ncbi:hypothetical protein YC2023_021515 [Brassica napus]
MTGGGASTVITRNGLLSDLIFPHRIILERVDLRGYFRSFASRLDDVNQSAL